MTNIIAIKMHKLIRILIKILSKSDTTVKDENLIFTISIRAPIIYFGLKLLLQNCEAKLVSVWRSNGLIITLLIVLFLYLTDLYIL